METESVDLLKIHYHSKNKFSVQLGKSTFGRSSTLMIYFAHSLLLSSRREGETEKFLYAPGVF